MPRLERIDVRVGFGASLRPDEYPSPGVLAKLVDDGCPPADIWNTVLLHALDEPAVREQARWADRVGWVREHPEELDRTLARIDHEADERGRTWIILFDALDRLNPDRGRANQLIRGVLEIARTLRTGTRNLRAKIFIRPDMLTDQVLGFPDSSELTANTGDLTWSETNLYGLLFHHLGNAVSAEAARFRSGHPGWRDDGDRHVLPRDLSRDQDAQRKTFVEIAGEYMGANYRKGHTYPWLPNHLMDGHRQVSPRSFLSALREAVRITAEQFPEHRYALHYDGIRRGVRETSYIRVREVTEDMPWVRPCLDALAGSSVPVSADDVIDRWRESQTEREAPSDTAERRRPPAQHLGRGEGRQRRADRTGACRQLPRADRGRGDGPAAQRPDRPAGRVPDRGRGRPARRHPPLTGPAVSFR